jgi:DeoR/GlpR family transcriptional regulator of sugar metabolism
MLAEERRQQILLLLQKDGSIIAKALAEQFEMSVDSIRRDLTILEEQGLLQKTYGGAILKIPVPKVRTPPQPESIRYGKAAPHQDAISKLAASFIKKDDTVFIGGAGIHFGMLRFLPKDIPFTVVTNSLKIAESIKEQENIISYLIGGKLKAGSVTMTDALAIEAISKFTLDIGYITGGGIASSGISTASPEGAAFTRAVSQVSRKKICLAPYEKIGQRMFIVSVPIENMDIVITDQAAPESAIHDIESRHVKVIFSD